MHKKLISACFAALVLAAVALPAAAQAVNHPLITHPTGTALPVESGGVKTKITATNVSGVSSTMNTTPDAGVQLTCTTVSMTGELTSNTTGNVAGNITTASFTSGGGACTGFFNATVDPLTLPWCLTSTEAMANDEFQVRGGACSGAATKIKFKLTSAAGACEYESTFAAGAVKGTYTTHSTGDAILSVPRTGHTPSEDAGFTKIKDETPFSLCPESSGLRMSLTLETDKTGTAEPLYISE